MQPRPTHLCQLAASWLGKLPDGGAMMEEKRDGFRALYLPDHTGKRRLFTRNGHRIEGAGHILHRLSMMEAAAGVPMMFDGEFQVNGTLAATKLWCERGWKAGGEAGHFHVFDCLTLADWQAGGSAVPLHERKAMLQRLDQDADADDWTWRPGSHGRDDGLAAVTVLPDLWACDVRDVLDQARRVWAADGEGLMLKDAESPYQRNRSDAWQKVKIGGAYVRKIVVA